ncbi:ABC transporter ATP-binding protein [Microbacterium sp. 18062]|uniref:dipeptide ABC transporter ATP-binding protein n=1 Tax=Microbacterium sp. 18062 TaxID=2681410 RepID=UPI001357DFF8|nr:ABC transporter ATP-binding protein [Microbacterium sp. 18062]
MIDRNRVVLDIEKLTIAYGDNTVVRDVDLTVRAGEIYGLIGESGSGKSSIAMACLRLLDSSAAVSAERLAVDGDDVRSFGAREMTRLRGRRMAMVFQDAMGALDPTMRVGRQIEEVVRRHRGLSRRDSRQEAIALLGRVGVPNAPERVDQFPHQLSGGLRQRAAIALALAGEPDLIFADEPTTALDVTVQAGILELFRRIRDELGVAIVLISHDMGVIAQTADRVGVMLRGELVEHGSAAEVLLRPQHEYTRRLLAAAPTVDGDVVPTTTDSPVKLRVRDVSRVYKSGGRPVTALRGVSLDVHEGEVLGIVGESGSGKSTLAKLLVQLESPTTGTIALDGEDYSRMRGAALRRFRRRVQMVFQHPAGSLNPRLRVGRAVAEPLAVADVPADRLRERVAAAFREVGMAGFERRLPFELSGGQKQRVGVARSIAGSPEIILLDEPTSALDLSVQAQILSLLTQLRAAHGLTMIMISHNLAVVRAMSDRVAVMRAGEVVEIGTAHQIFTHPQHPYTRELLDAVPSPNPAVRSSREVMEHAA